MATSNALDDRQRLRSDARRSISKILDAAIRCFSENREVSMSSVARAAGVGRTTLYEHFPTRDALLEATMVHAITRSNAILDGLELDRVSPVEAVQLLIESSWQVIGSYGALINTVEGSLGAAALRDHHHEPLERVAAVITRGQEESVFRVDLPREWLVAVFYTMMHTAVREVDSGRLDVTGASHVAAVTYLAVLRDTSARTKRQA